MVGEKSKSCPKPIKNRPNSLKIGSVSIPQKVENGYLAENKTAVNQITVSNTNDGGRS